LDTNLIFGHKFNFWTQIIWRKNINFRKNWNFGQQLKCWTKNEILAKNWNFEQELQLWANCICITNQNFGNWKLTVLAVNTFKKIYLKSKFRPWFNGILLRVDERRRCRHWFRDSRKCDWWVNKSPYYLHLTWVNIN